MRHLVRAVLLPLVLAVPVLTGCSDPGPVELSEVAEGVVLLERARAETTLDTVLVAASQVSGEPLSYARLYDLTGSDAEVLVAHDEGWLTGQGWERQDAAPISGSLGTSWERDGQRLVLALLTLDASRIAAVLTSPASR